MSGTTPIPDHELTWRFGPSGGPGGQHANRAHTRAEVVFEVEASTALTESQRARVQTALGPVVRVTVDETRSQARNRQIANDRLQARVANALRPVRVRRATRPGKGAVKRRLEDKRRQSQRKANRRPAGDD
ncbi:MAG: alternative ribosome rescue aminoacyl-tRNA hydrolase ArfB [Actinomycetota bacterium]|nr:alternative ribosome rescue aminoacyl-tRNA hydrolase ArfB [Actinomycetota bacterium]